MNDNAAYGTVGWSTTDVKQNAYCLISYNNNW